MHRIFYLIISVMAGLLLINPSAESVQKFSAAKKPGYGGTLVWGTQFQPTILNPIISTHSISLPLIDLIFNKLVRLNSKGEYEPDLAEHWELSPDGRVYTFYLHKGVRFHDGVELTAQDVRVTFEQVMDPVNNSPHRSRFDMIDHIEVVDAYTIRFYLRKQIPSLISRFSYPIMPRHSFEEKDINENPSSYFPVGSGPFRFVQWNPKTNEIVLEDNPDYFEGRPYLGRIMVKVYPDASSLWSAMMRHEVDLVQFISEADYKVLSKDPAFKVYAVSAEVYSAIMYNLHDPVLAELAVRQAIAYSIDVEGMLNRLSNIQGIKSIGPFHPRSSGFNPDVKPLEYNPEQAAKILEENGWQDLNRDGILEKNGRDLEIRMLVDDRDPIHKKAALVLRQQLAATKIKLKILLYKDTNELNQDYLTFHQPQAWLRYYPGYVSGESDAVNPWYSGFTMPGQLWKYQNDELDRLIEKARTELNSDKSHALYKKIHQLIYEEQSACFLFFHEGFFALSARCGGAEDFFNVNMPTYTMKDWYLIDQK